MNKQIEEVSNWGKHWQGTADWAAHTYDRRRASVAARGYAWLIAQFIPDFSLKNACGLDIGAGAGNIAAALAGEFGVDMTASEYAEAGVALINKENPHLATRQIDVMDFNDSASWDLIVCRELYPFTRVNQFPEQMAAISRIVTALRPGGVFLLIGSDVAYPDCLDGKRMRQELKSDGRVTLVSPPVLEYLLRFPRLVRTASIFGTAGVVLLSRMADFLIGLWGLLRRRRIAVIRIVLIRKR